jgi:hypothetical protein
MEGLRFVHRSMYLLSFSQQPAGEPIALQPGERMELKRTFNIDWRIHLTCKTSIVRGWIPSACPKGTLNGLMD